MLSFASVTPTIDVFEIVLALLAVLVALPMTAYNLRAGWGEMQWAIDDPDPTMRRLGAQRFFNGLLLFLIVLAITLATFSGFMVPSSIQNMESITDVVNALVQRTVFIAVVVCIVLKSLSDAWWRQDADGRRTERKETLADAAKVAKHLEDALHQHQIALEHNIALTEDARDRASKAYEVANTVNEKLAGIGLRVEAGQMEATEQAARERAAPAPEMPSPAPKDAT